MEGLSGHKSVTEAVVDRYKAMKVFQIIWRSAPPSLPLPSFRSAPKKRPKRVTNDTPNINEAKRRMCARAFGQEGHDIDIDTFSLLLHFSFHTYCVWGGWVSGGSNCLLV